MPLENLVICEYPTINKTRQGYARQHILKPAGYFFLKGNVTVIKRSLSKPATTYDQQIQTWFY